MKLAVVRVFRIALIASALLRACAPYATLAKNGPELSPIPYVADVKQISIIFTDTPSLLRYPRAKAPYFLGDKSVSLARWYEAVSRWPERLPAKGQRPRRPLLSHLKSRRHTRTARTVLVTRPLHNASFILAATSSTSVQIPRPYWGGYVTVTDFGAVGDGIHDDTSAIQDAINYTHNSTMGGRVILPAGVFSISRCLVTYGNIWLSGVGPHATVISKKNNASCPAGSIAAPGRKDIRDDYKTADALVAVVHPPSDYAYLWQISGLQLENATATPSTYGIYSPRSSQFQVSNVRITNVVIGFYANDDWLATITHTAVDTATVGYQWADDGSGQGTGTTVSLDNVWATHIKSRCFDIFGLSYSSFSSLACDNYNAAKTDLPASDPLNAAYVFNTSTAISINGAGAENVYGQVLAVQNTRISITAMRTFDVTGGKSAAPAPSYIYSDASGIEFHSCDFTPYLEPGDYFNTTIQNGSRWQLTNTILPLGGNTFNSYSRLSEKSEISASGADFVNKKAFHLITPEAEAFGETSQPRAVFRSDICYGDSSSHKLKCSYNGGSFFAQTQTIGTGTAVTAGTLILPGACQQVPVPIKGATNRDLGFVNMNELPPATWSSLSWNNPVVTADTCTIEICNASARPQTPPAWELRCTVIR